MNLNSTLTALRSTTGAVLGRVDGLFDVQTACYRGVLVIDTDAVTPGSTELLQPGQRREALVRIGNPGGGTQAIRSVSVISPPVGNFRSIGTLSVSEQVHEGDKPIFSARNSGGNIRPLPPVSFY